MYIYIYVDIHKTSLEVAEMACRRFLETSFQHGRPKLVASSLLGRNIDLALGVIFWGGGFAFFDQARNSGTCLFRFFGVVDMTCGSKSQMLPICPIRKQVWSSAEQDAGLRGYRLPKWSLQAKSLILVNVFIFGVWAWISLLAYQPLQNSMHTYMDNHC